MKNDTKNDIREKSIRISTTVYFIQLKIATKRVIIIIHLDM